MTPATDNSIEEPSGRSRALYPLGLTALAVAMLGGLFTALDSGEPLPSSGEVEPLKQVDQIGPGIMELVHEEEPVELESTSESPAQFTLQLRQIGGANSEQAPLDVRALFAGTEHVEPREHGRRIDRNVVLTDLELLYRDQRLEQPLVRLLGADTAGVHRQMDQDRGARILHQAWDDDDSVRPLYALAEALIDVLMPRLPDEPVFVGENWHYRLGEPAPAREYDIGVEITAELAAVYEDDHRRVVGIDRRISADVHKPGARVDDDAEAQSLLTVRGEGMAYFDIDNGRLVASNLEARQYRNGADDPEQVGVIKAAWFVH